MRVLQIILAIYVLSMVIYPCSDVDTALEKQETNMIVADAGNHNETNTDKDACSPFCICSCCATHIQLNSTSSVIAINQIQNSESITFYLSSPILHSAHSIWQPPKI